MDALSTEPVAPVVSWESVIQLSHHTSPFKPLSYFSKEFDPQKEQVAEFLNEFHGVDEIQEMLKQLESKGSSIKVYINNIGRNSVDLIGNIHLDMEADNAKFFYNFDTGNHEQIPWQRALLHELFHITDPLVPNLLETLDDPSKDIIAEERAVRFVDGLGHKIPHVLGVRGIYCNSADHINEVPQYTQDGLDNLLIEQQERIDRAMLRVEKNITIDDSDMFKTSEGKQYFYDRLNACTY